MLAGEVPFRGSASEVMQGHQRASLPLEQLKGVPQPVLVLLEVMLEKDPTQRFQSPAELLKAIPLVTAAINAERSVTQQDLRAISGERLVASGKSGKFSAADNLRLAGDQLTKDLSKAKTRKQTIRWLQGAGGCLAIALITWFFASGHLGLFNQRSTEAATTEKSVAVLPFESLSESKSDAYFADGVQDEILNHLAKIAQLKVISRTSVMQYRADSKRDLRQIADALGVANVLEGTVRRDGNHVRVSTELVDARNDNTIWADSYDRDLTNIFAIQSEIAQTVAARLSAQLSSEERKDIEEKPTTNLEAYDLYLQAKQLLGPESVVTLWGSEKEAYSKAINLLEEAIQKDHEFTVAYCMIAKAHDYLYSDRVDHTSERCALGDAAVNEALRLRPDLAEVHLAAAIHLFYCYRDFERAGVQIAMAQTLPNNPDLVQLTAMIDQVQGRWEKATTGLEKATTLDPRNPELLDSLANNYWLIRRYRDYERISDRLVQLEPDEPLFKLNKAQAAFAEKADLKGVRAAFEALPASMKDDAMFTSVRIYYAICTRDFAAAEEIVTKSPNEEIRFFGAAVPRRIVTLWLELVQGNHPTTGEFGAAREQLHQKVEADPTDPFLMQALAMADLALGRKDESMQEARRALEMRPISEDAVDGPYIAAHVAMFYAWENQANLAFEQLSILIKMPGGLITYGDLKTGPAWDSLRKDPRFDKLLAELAPRD